MQRSYTNGILTEHPTILQWRKTLANQPDFNTDLIHKIHHPVTAWTDGACTDQACIALRTAGFGVFFIDQHPSNVSSHLPGSDQTSVRAEFFAAMVAISITTNDLYIQTDCFYVFTNLRKLPKHQHINTNCWNHRDLWKRIQHDIVGTNRVITVNKKLRAMLRTMMSLLASLLNSTFMGIMPLTNVLPMVLN